MHRSVVIIRDGFDAATSGFESIEAKREHLMNNSLQTLKNENGYMAILASLMILALLTILGVAASKSANTEVLMSGNEIRYQRNFYRAEGAAMEAADILQNAANLADNLPSWIEPYIGKLTLETVSGYWDNSSADGDTVIPQPSAVDTNHTWFVAGSEGIAPGGSLGMDKPTVHSLAIYGRCEWDGVTTIKVGYLVAY